MSTPRSLTLPAGVVPTTITTGRGSFAALGAGPVDPASPVVLLVPGWTGSKEDFADLLPVVAAAGRRVVAIDQRGQLDTPGPEDEAAYTLPELADDVLAVAAALSSRPVDLVGHSFGGLVAARAAIADPWAVNSLVLLCAGTGAVPPDQHAALEAVVRSLDQDGPARTWARMRAHEAALGTQMPPEHIEAWLRRRFLAGSVAALQATARHLIDAPDHRRSLRRVPVPALVLTGSLDDRWPVDDQQAIAREIGAESVLLTGVGHSPAVEDPARTASALGDFWSRWAPSREPLDVVLTGGHADVPRARRLVRDQFAATLTPDRLADVELLTSELVTNAVIHARPPVVLRAAVRDGHVVVTVSDSGGGHDLSREDHGRGLALVLALARRCGAWQSAAGTTVWFWLPLDPPSGGPACSAPVSGSTSAPGVAVGPTEPPAG